MFACQSMGGAIVVDAEDTDELACACVLRRLRADIETPPRVIACAYPLQVIAKSRRYIARERTMRARRFCTSLPTESGDSCRLPAISWHATYSRTGADSSKVAGFQIDLLRYSTLSTRHLAFRSRAFALWVPGAKRIFHVPRHAR
jgi:hypothetical protein